MSYYSSGSKNKKTDAIVDRGEEVMTRRVQDFQLRRRSSILRNFHRGESFFFLLLCFTVILSGIDLTDRKSVV